MASMISLEDHFMSSVMQARPEFGLASHPQEVARNLTSLGSDRLQSMDEGNVALQVVSSVPVSTTLPICQEANNELAAAVRGSNGRLAGFAALPMSDPQAAAEELERCVRQLGFVGALVPNHADGVYYDGDTFRTFWRKAQELDVPIYIHPCTTERSRAPFFDLPDDRRLPLASFAFDRNAEVGIHFLRLWASGLFEEEDDAVPKLKLILGHAGEMVPFMLSRAKRMASYTEQGKTQKRDLEQVWRENVWVTLSGMWDLTPLVTLLSTTDVGRVMYSLDYPFEDAQEGKEFMERLKASGIVTQEGFDSISFRNAEKLLRVNKP